jgi:hypothetical protein
MVEVKRSRILKPRLSNDQAQAMLEKVKDFPWSTIPRSARLADADPEVRNGLFDHMLRLYSPLLDIRGVKHGKASKLLHLARPALFPILDETLRYVYDPVVSRSARRAHAPNSPMPYWIAIRGDVVRNGGSLEEVRQQMRLEDGLLGKMARLSDVRLLDLVAWDLKAPREK